MAANAISAGESNLEYILSANQQAEELATSGEWEAVSELLMQRDAALRDVDDNDREAALLATLRSTEQLRALVEKAKDEIGKELGQIKRGREATETYGANR